MRHKHYDVLRAIADGNEVQINIDSKWTDVSEIDLFNRYDPFNNPDDEWRVKPEPKPDYTLTGRVNYMISDTFSAYGGFIDALITFDGETRAAKSIEIVK
jgi:hypothetical protein